MKNVKVMPEMHHVCTSDELRPVMNHVLITKEYFVATNAHAMVWHKTDDFFSEEFILNIPTDGFLIHKQDWAKFKGCKSIVLNGEIIEINFDKKRPVFIKPEINNGDVGKYPQWEAVIPQWRNLTTNNLPINPDLLIMAKKAIGTGKENVSLHYTGDRRAILIRSCNDEYNSYNKAAGLIMPVVYPFNIEEYAVEDKELQTA